MMRLQIAAGPRAVAGGRGLPQRVKLGGLGRARAGVEAGVHGQWLPPCTSVVAFHTFGLQTGGARTGLEDGLAVAFESRADWSGGRLGVGGIAVPWQWALPGASTPWAAKMVGLLLPSAGGQAWCALVVVVEELLLGRPPSAAFSPWSRSCPEFESACSEEIAAPAASASARRSSARACRRAQRGGAKGRSLRVHRRWGCVLALRRAMRRARARPMLASEQPGRGPRQLTSSFEDDVLLLGHLPDAARLR